MIVNVRRTWFEVWGTEEAQNRFLKALLVFFISLFFVETVALVVMALRKPPIIAVSATQSRVLTVIPPSAELLDSEIRRAINGYVSARYNWDYTNVAAQSQKAASYVHPDFRQKFQAATQDQARVAQEKKLSERFYVNDLQLDPKTKTARISGDRILVIDGLRAAAALQYEIQYDQGPRTEENPEGIYVTGEKTIPSEGGVR